MVLGDIKYSAASFGTVSPLFLILEII